MQRPPFTALASVYDAIMADIEYDAWADFILTYARSENFTPSSVLDLACGTGASTEPFVKRGLDVVGVDGSADMLKVARSRVPNVEFVLGDLRTFDLSRRFDLVTCLFDSLNNLTASEDLGAAFSRVYAHLAPGGLFAFDINTRSGVRDLWEGDALEGLAVTPDGREVHYHWSHHYDAARDLGVVQAFCRVEGEEFVEVHEERGYDQFDLEPLLAAAGFGRWEFVEFPDFAPPEFDAPRVWVFAWKAFEGQGLPSEVV
ncbi:class I SAM-dependent DNA methyltransferase [Deinococcus yavapaiensis]|uniref:Methyltransferase family protein n=1 Tax=Deinococcus yavapaiensis KR-236 TaxID=694435 RepID=A0A318S044_9DEIO|nr:class I SAM-dependent methyltransferase [Deinococcus yavapaiensis]PYE50024.1 methyltransferase family protein [Deinococcus yavapaiensis KR-236]